MNMIGTVESLWRYPVKSMRGEEMEEMFAGYAGVYGDRLFAFESSASPKGFPFFTGREQRQMIRYCRASAIRRKQRGRSTWAKRKNCRRT